MQSILLEGWGRVPALREVANPQRISGHSLVRMHASTVSHLDITIASGEFAVHPDVPYVPGVEGAGEVLESESWQPGSQVLVRGAGVGVVVDGTWRSLACVPDEALTLAPAGMDYDQAACFFVPTTTAYVAVHDICQVSADSVILVTGASGAVGSMAVQFAWQAGATVVGVTRDPKQWHGPRSDKIVICSSEEDISSIVGRPIDCMVDTVAGPDFQTILGHVASGGVCAIVGYAGGDVPGFGVANFILGDVALVPVNMLRRDERAREVAPDLARRLMAGDLSLDVSAYPPERFIQAMDDVRTGAIRGRAVLKFSS